MSKNDNWLPSEKEVEEFLLLERMLSSQKRELDLLSIKKADGQLNKMKIKMINRVLSPLSDLFKNEPSKEFLEILDEDDLPTNSDVVFIISQYITAISEFRKKYYKEDEYQSDYSRTVDRWMTKEYPPDYYK